MANIPLQSITFPGLADKYTTPTVDATLTQTGAAADAKKTGDEIAELKNDFNQFPNGTYPNMSVGNADQLTATVGIEDNTPYLFRTSGGSNDIGDREDVRKIVGGTIPWNQEFNKAGNVTHSAVSSGSVSMDSATGTVTISPDGASTIFYWFQSSAHWFAGHKVFVSQKVTASASCGYALRCETISSFTGISANVGTTINKIISVGSYTGTAALGGVVQNITEAMTITAENIQFTDLTHDFGTSIADYVYSLEQATAGAGVAWLKKHFPAQFDAGYQAYDTGSLQSVSGLVAHKMVGFNQLDADSAFEGATGITKSGNSFTGNASAFASFTGQNGWEKIKYISGLTYYGRAHITVPNSTLTWARVEWIYTDGTKTVGNQILTNSSGVSYALSNPNKTISHFNITYGSNGGNPMSVKDININLHWDGERDGEYEPYQEWVYSLDSTLTFRGIPKVDAQGNLYYDGDEYLPDGTVNRRYGLVDMGTLTWSYNPAYGFYCSIPSYIKPTPNSDVANARCVKYVATTAGNVASGNTNKSFAVGTSYVYVSDDAYTDAVTFKTAMSGVYLLYEKATAETETADPYQETQIVDDFGTEEFILADGAFPVPVGHETYYKSNLRAKLEMAPESPDGDGLYVVQQESGQNEYVPLASTSTIQDILTRLTALENA